MKERYQKWHRDLLLKRLSPEQREGVARHRKLRTRSKVAVDDLTRLICELRHGGLSYHDIASLLERDHTTIVYHALHRKVGMPRKGKPSKKL